MGPSAMSRKLVSVLPAIWLIMTPLAHDTQNPASEKKHLAVLKKIHAEVKEMGFYPGQNFIQQAFFVGEDDDDTNKDIHVSILIQMREDQDKMTIRVTQMLKDQRNPQARVAGTSRELTCLVGGDEVEIPSSDYDEKEIVRLAPEILTAILNKKRLLKIGTATNI